MHACSRWQACVYLVRKHAISKHSFKRVRRPAMRVRSQMQWGSIEDHFNCRPQSCLSPILVARTPWRFVFNGLARFFFYCSMEGAAGRQGAAQGVEGFVDRFVQQGSSKCIGRRRAHSAYSQHGCVKKVMMSARALAGETIPELALPWTCNAFGG